MPLPTIEEMFANALGRLDVAHKALGDARDWLRSDWRPTAASLTKTQSEARTAIFAAIAAAKSAINEAKDHAYKAMDHQ